jgi:hypothetical protein
VRRGGTFFALQEFDLLGPNADPHLLAACTRYAVVKENPTA